MPNEPKETPQDSNAEAKPEAKPETKPLKLSNRQLAAILNRVAELMLANAEAEKPAEPAEPADTEEPKDSETQKPYPSEHAARQTDPAQYTEIRRKNNAFGPGIHVIYGIKDGKTTVQSIRFATTQFTLAQAKAWLLKHQYSADKLEAAVAKALGTCTACGAAGVEMHIFDSKQLCLGCYEKACAGAENESEPEVETEDDLEAESEDTAMLHKSDITIIAKSTEKQIAYGIAYPAKPLGWSDSQGDWISVPEIERMAHNYMLKSQRYDVQHQRIAAANEACIVESYIAPCDFTLGGQVVSKGSWVVATHFPRADTWAAVKSGLIKSYSIKGHGKRKPISTNLAN